MAVRRAPAGRFRVLGIDKFDGTDWVEADVDTAVEALALARKKTSVGLAAGEGQSVATVFYAYDDQGTYLGGDVWKGE